MNEEKVCCPKFDPAPWENKEIVWLDKMFVKGKTISLFYMPLNMGCMMKKTWDKVEAAGGVPDPKDWVMLSKDISPWKCEHFLATSKEIANLENVKISGTFFSKVFEGPFKEAKNWYQAMQTVAKEKGIEAKDNIYFYYTTCPKCAKKWGKNYVVGLLKIK